MKPLSGAKVADMFNSAAWLVVHLATSQEVVSWFSDSLGLNSCFALSSWDGSDPSSDLNKLFNFSVLQRRKQNSLSRFLSVSRNISLLLLLNLDSYHGSLS